MVNPEADNEAPAIIATKAFGILKSNIVDRQLFKSKELLKSI
jgi:hypothetical protein